MKCLQILSPSLRSRFEEKVREAGHQCATVTVSEQCDALQSNDSQYHIVWASVTTSRDLKTCTDFMRRLKPPHFCIEIANGPLRHRIQQDEGGKYFVSSCSFAAPTNECDLVDIFLSHVKTIIDRKQVHSFKAGSMLTFCCCVATVSLHANKHPHARVIEDTFKLAKKACRDILKTQSGVDVSTLLRELNTLGNKMQVLTVFDLVECSKKSDRYTSSVTTMSTITKYFKKDMNWAAIVHAIDKHRYFKPMAIVNTNKECIAYKFTAEGLVIKKCPPKHALLSAVNFIGEKKNRRSAGVVTVLKINS